jgi:nucleotide-binding universal stress UspA family protein
MLASSVLVATIGALWLAIGLILALVMGRRGHGGFGWFVVGTMLGPIGLILAVDATRNDEVMNPAVIRPESVTRRHSGPVDVLVGYDGSPESAAALETVPAMLGEQLGRLTVATVVPYGDLREAERQREQMLRQLAADVPDRSFQLEVLHGQPAPALRDHAASDGYQLIAVGTRGRGITRAILGSAASELASKSSVPVLLVGAQAAGQIDLGGRARQTTGPLV